MFRVANTYDFSDPKFGEIFETAVRLFPQDQTANLNAASSSMIHGDVARAKRYLDRADRSTVEYINNRGVYELLSENYDEARVWLERAKENGSKQAEHNLAELERKVATLYFKKEAQSD
jgi:Flp pilus assembly protein TadD